MEKKRREEKRKEEDEANKQTNFNTQKTLVKLICTKQTIISPLKKRERAKKTKKREKENEKRENLQSTI